MSGGGGGKEGGRGMARPIRKQVFSSRSRKQSFLLVTLGTHLRKKKPGFLKLFTRDGSNRTDALIFIFFLKRIFFHPGRFFFNRRGLIFFRGQFFFQQTRPNFFPGGTGNRNFLATSYPPTYLPTCPLPLPPLSSYQTEKKEGGGGGEPLLPGGAPVWTGP